MAVAPAPPKPPLILGGLGGPLFESVSAARRAGSTARPEALYCGLGGSSAALLRPQATCRGDPGAALATMVLHGGFGLSQGLLRGHS